MTLHGTIEELVWSRVYATEFARLEEASRGPGENSEDRRGRLLGVAQFASIAADESIVALRYARGRREG